MTGAKLPRYGQPPVIEAVAGLEFVAAETDFSAQSIAIANEFVDELRPAGFVEPISPTQRLAVEAPFQPFFRVGNGPNPVRLLLQSEDLVWLLQVQNNRIVLNWRKATPESQYPGYEVLKGRLEECVGRIVALSVIPSPLAPQATEFTYVNGITHEQESASDVFCLFSPSALQRVPGREVATRFQLIRDVPEKAAQLSISSEPRIVQSGTGAILTITSNVFSAEGADLDAAMAGLDDAHILAREAFVAVTTQAMRQTWGETTDEHS